MVKEISPEARISRMKLKTSLAMLNNASIGVAKRVSSKSLPVPNGRAKAPKNKSWAIIFNVMILLIVLLTLMMYLPKIQMSYFPIVWLLDTQINSIPNFSLHFKNPATLLL